MKTKMISSKLTLSKATVTNLNTKEMNNVNGGDLSVDLCISRDLPCTDEPTLCIPHKCPPPGNTLNYTC